jgi:hypothetical protein
MKNALLLASILGAVLAGSPGPGAAAAPPDCAELAQLIAIAVDGAPRLSVRRRVCPALGLQDQGGGAGVGVVNGDFASGLDGWTASESGGTAAPGGVAAAGGQALVSEGDSFLVTLEQRFRVPSFATLLRFELTVDPGFDRSADFIPDAFEASILDDAMLPLVEPWDSLATSSFNLQEDGTANMGPGVVWDGLACTIDVGGIPAGTLATLYFDLIGADGDTLSALRIDNVAMATSPPQGAFLRGDPDASGEVDLADAQSVLDYLWTSGPPARGCAGAVDLDSADVNDNEWITIADFLALRSALAGSGEVPPPAADCGLDPDGGQRGFDAIDAAYRVTAGDIVVSPPTGAVDREVLVPILVDTPSPVTGLTVILEYDPSVLTPSDPSRGEPPPFASGLGTTAFHVADARLVVGLWAAAEGEVLLDAAPGSFQAAGMARFHLADFAILRPFAWSREAQVGAVRFRATVADDLFRDHHPELPVGEFEFVRGNSNNDARVDISDPVNTLSWLFLGSREPPCLDAADANNDSAIDITDPIFTLSFLFIGGAPIPPPYPQCGLDQGPIDRFGCDPCACPPYPVGHPCRG